MKPIAKLFAMNYDPDDRERRDHRFRCQAEGCKKIIADPCRIVIERRGKSSHGYHFECFADHVGRAGISSAYAAWQRANATDRENLASQGVSPGATP